MRTRILFFCLMFIMPAGYAQVRILFDASKAQMAGNADWVIDADMHNLGTNSNGAMVSGAGDDSNPQGIPSPSQSAITASTAETYWQGALSAWAVDCAKRGYQVESLPYNDSITYGNASHARDLSHYNVYIVDEPNILYTLAEKNAIVNFVKNGGGLFIIADHDVSDRNGDGYDSPTIWNDLFTTNTVKTNPFGITFDLQNFSQTSTNIASLPTDTCLHGPMGNVTKIQYSGGTTMTLNPSNNNTVKGLIYKTGASNIGSTEVLFARAYYGSGKVCAMGDSSPADDGTGDPNDILYDGYFADAAGNHQLLLMNATIWLATTYKIPASTSDIDAHANTSLQLYPNPSQGDIQLTWQANPHESFRFEVLDLQHRVIMHKEKETTTTGTQHETLEGLSPGFYLLKMIGKEGTEVVSFVIE